MQVRPRRVLANITNERSGRDAKKSSKTAKTLSWKATTSPGHLVVDDVFDNMRANESRYYTCEDYITNLKQICITHKMRTILMSWMVEVADEYNLCCQTIHLAVYLVDAFLARQQHLPRTNLQLVGVAAMLIAAKYEEMQPPSADDCSYITDYTYSSYQVLDMERTILVTMQFRISVVTSLEFRQFFHCDHPLVNYLLELALMHPLGLAYRPSQLAAAACAYVRAVIGEQIWPEILKTRSSYTFDELSPIIVQFHDLHQKSVDRHSFRHRKVARMSPLRRLPSAI